MVLNYPATVKILNIMTIYCQSTAEGMRLFSQRQNQGLFMKILLMYITEEKRPAQQSSAEAI